MAQELTYSERNIRFAVLARRHCLDGGAGQMCHETRCVPVANLECFVLQPKEAEHCLLVEILEVHL